MGPPDDGEKNIRYIPPLFFGGGWGCPVMGNVLFSLGGWGFSVWVGKAPPFVFWGRVGLPIEGKHIPQQFFWWGEGVDKAGQ